MGKTRKRKTVTPATALPGADEHVWRRQHDPVERVSDQIADAAGNIGNPWRAIGVLAAMERRGTITAGMRAAGDRFHELFVLAHLEPLHAADMSRVGYSSNGSAFRGNIGAADAINAALNVLGGHSAVAACCAWFVLGCEYSLRQWASREGWRGRPLQAHAASGILIASLGVLQKHFGC